MQNKIFTFWEPMDTIPAYLELCIDTWKKYLPNYEIVILNYCNLFDWIEKDTFDEILYKDFSLPKQADAIRCAILKKYGGIWLDIDTIITSNKITEILNINSEFTLIGFHIAFIKASKNCEILQRWFDEINRKITNFKRLKEQYNKMSLLKKIFNRNLLKKINSWDYFGNSILNELLECNKYKKELIDKNNSKAFPEINWARINNKELNLKKVYREFYFKNNYSSYAINDNCGIICLHNSWTPSDIKVMNKKEFLELDNTLSKIFLKIL